MRRRLPALFLLPILAATSSIVAAAAPAPLAPELPRLDVRHWLNCPIESARLDL
jgi:hypothetical protein